MNVHVKSLCCFLKNLPCTKNYLKNFTGKRQNKQWKTGKIKAKTKATRLKDNLSKRKNTTPNTKTNTKKTLGSHR